MKRSFGVFIVVVVASMAMAGMALAEDAEDTTDVAMTSPLVTVDVDDEGTATVTVGIPDEDGVMPDCEPEDGEEGEEGPDAEAPVDADEGDDEEVVAYGPGDCVDLVVDHPSGKMHHGAIVSTVAKGLHPSMLDGVKKGHIMREVAKNGYLPDDFEGLDDDDDDDDDGDDDGDEPKAKADKPARGNSENAKNKDKPNKGKKNN